MATDHDRFRGPLDAAFARALDAAGTTGASRAAAIAALLRPAAAALPVPPASERAVWDAGGGSADRATRTALLAHAERELGTPWPIPLASTAARLHRDGDRDGHEQLVFARQRRLSRAVVAAATTLSDRWVDEAADGLWLLCEQSSWCWPAHDDAFAVRGSVLPDVTDPYLDLGAGEVAGQLGWADHLLGDVLDGRYPGLRARIRHEVRVRIVEPFVRRRDWHWLGLDGDVHNWNPWIHGNVLVAALRLLDGVGDAPLRAHVVDLVLEGLDRYVASLPDDGAIDEGYGYWWNGACRALEALDLLAHATGGALDALGHDGAAAPSLRATVAFPHRMHLGDGWYLNLADGQARPSAEQPWHALHRAARRAGDRDAAAHAAVHRVPGEAAAHESDGLGRLLRALTDADWLAAASAPASSPLPGEVWLGSTQVLLARERAGTSAGLALAVKGGHNGEHHNHNDVGTVVVASDGVPVVVDAGRPTYTAQTFGPDRYAIWTMQSSWHSVPEVAGTPQGVGREYHARDAAPALDPGRPGLTLDLAGAYPVPGLRSWRRAAHLERAPATGERVAADRGRARVVVDDAWDLQAAPGAAPTSVRYLLAGEVELSRGSVVVHPLDDATPVRLSWRVDVPATLHPRPLDDPLLADVWGARLTRLDLDVTDRREVRVVVEQLPGHGHGHGASGTIEATTKEET